MLGWIALVLGYALLVMGADKFEKCRKENILSPGWAVTAFEGGSSLLLIGLLSVCVIQLPNELVLALSLMALGGPYPIKFLNSIAMVTGPIPPGTGV